MLMIAGGMASRTAAKSASFDALQGMGRSVPGAGALFLLGGLALAGLPPLNGFVGKWMLFRSGADDARVVAVALLAASSLLSLIYIARSYQMIWWTPREDGGVANTSGDSFLAPALLIARVLRCASSPNLCCAWLRRRSQA